LDFTSEMPIDMAQLLERWRTYFKGIK